MKKYVAGAGIAAALLTGSVAIAAWSPIGLAGAQDTTTSESTDTTVTPSTDAPTTESTEAPSTTDSTEAPAPDTAAPPADDKRSSDFGPLSQSLDELVAEGVITQEQADAIRDRVDQNRKAWEQDHPHFGRGGFGELRESAQAIADALGMSVEDLTKALMSGSSLNDLAAQQGVDPAVISKILTDESNAKIDQAVADGNLTQDKADEIKSKIADNIGKVMDGSIKGLGGFGHGPGGPGHHGWGGGDDDGSGDTPSTDSGGA